MTVTNHIPHSLSKRADFVSARYLKVRVKAGPVDVGYAEPVWSENSIKMEVRGSPN
jgi:hypothetical protein